MDIVLSHVTKAYDGEPVLSDFSARLREGETTVLMGPSGIGKTTLLLLLLGLVSPDSGEITGLPEKVSVIFQEDRLCEDFSALSNVAMVLPRGGEERASALLKALGLEEAMRQPVHTLSGGMKRRVAIARGLAADSPLLLMDEPFKGLDGATRRQVMEAVRAETAGKTLLLITHDPEEAAFWGGQLLKLEKTEEL